MFSRKQVLCLKIENFEEHQLSRSWIFFAEIFHTFCVYNVDKRMFRIFFILFTSLNKYYKKILEKIIKLCGTLPCLIVGVGVILQFARFLLCNSLTYDLLILKDFWKNPTTPVKYYSPPCLPLEIIHFRRENC